MYHADYEAELRYWVWLSMIFGAESTRLLCALRQYDSPQEIYDAIQAGQFTDFPAYAQKSMLKCSIGEADTMIYYCKQHGIELLSLSDPRYPSPLRSIQVPPVLLTAQGNLDLLKTPLMLSVVGTRKPSPYTEQVTQTLMQELAKYGFTIVSGFAKGVDGIAHKATLDAGGATIAVLGCGVNVNYPREHAELRNRMLSSGKGLFLSEYLPGTQPIPANFPKRNRILSGLSFGTAVMEAADRSGSLLTAQYASEQGRALLCVPPADLFDARYAGVISLLRDGAMCLMSHRDVLQAIYLHAPQHIKLPDSETLRAADSMIFADTFLLESQPQEAKAKSAKAQSKQADTAVSDMAIPLTIEDRPESPTEFRKEMPESELGAAIVICLRTNGAMYVDHLAAKLDVPLHALLTELTVLELDGFVESMFGKQYCAL